MRARARGLDCRTDCCSTAPRGAKRRSDPGPKHRVLGFYLAEDELSVAIKDVELANRSTKARHILEAEMLIDAHSHIDRYGLLDEGMLDSALREVNQYRILTVSNSMDLPSYQRTLAIGERCRFVLPIFGVHPWNAPEYAGHLEDLTPAIEQSAMLGEIGLDFHFIEDASHYPSQRKVLEFFLTAAREQGKIVNLHTKGAEAEMLRLLDKHHIERAIVHWYSGPLAVFRELATRGVYFTVGIEVRYSEHLRTIVREVPSGQLLTETDNPGGPRSFIGGYGMPSLIKDVVHALAELRGVSTETIVQTVQSNFRTLIHDDPGLRNYWASVLDEQCENT
jgi:TatD DNase family protein